MNWHLAECKGKSLGASKQSKIQTLVCTKEIEALAVGKEPLVQNDQKEASTSKLPRNPYCKFTKRLKSTNVNSRSSIFPWWDWKSHAEQMPWAMYSLPAGKKDGERWWESGAPGFSKTQVMLAMTTSTRCMVIWYFWHLLTFEIIINHSWTQAPGYRLAAKSMVDA